MDRIAVGVVVLGIALSAAQAASWLRLAGHAAVSIMSWASSTLGPQSAAD